MWCVFILLSINIYVLAPLYAWLLNWWRAKGVTFGNHSAFLTRCESVTETFKYGGILARCEEISITLFCPVDLETFCVSVNRVVELFLKHDARPGVRDKEGYNAIHYAALNGQTCKLALEMVSGGCDMRLCPQFTYIHKVQTRFQKDYNNVLFFFYIICWRVK